MKFHDILAFYFVCTTDIFVLVSHGFQTFVKITCFSLLVETYNQRTNGKINAHLKSWICIGQGHPGVMIYINFVLLHSLMLQAKFQNHRSSRSEE